MGQRRRGRSAPAASLASVLTVRRRFPATLAEWTATWPTLPSPTGIWLFDEPASPILDRIGSKHLTQNQAMLYQRQGDPEGRLSLEIDTGNASEFAVSPSTADADIGAGQNRSLLVRARAPDLGVIVAIAGAGTVNTNPHWGIQFGANGRLTAKAFDGTVSLTPNTPVVYDDNQFHDAAFSLDRAGGLLHIITESDDNTQALAGLGAIDCDTGLRVGSYSGRVPIIGEQISYMAMFDAVFTAAHMAIFRTPI